MEINEKQIEIYFNKLWPLMRSITGEGVRETHKILSELMPLKTIEIPSGTNVIDWTVPKEWNVNEAYIIDPNGEKILDVSKNNLHLLNYSIPFKGVVSKAELEKHLYSLPDMPNAIPYITSYYKERWGFCIEHNKKKKLIEGNYNVCIDTELKNGSLTYSECILKGKRNKEVLISTYTCHPSLANNELSGPISVAFLYNLLKEMPDRELTYRFVIIPETIGSIIYLKKNRKKLVKNVIAGFVITCIGDKANYMYKRTREKNTISNRVVEYYFNKISNNQTLILDMNFDEYKNSNINQSQPRIINFFPDNGSDERQYNAPGNNLPIGSLMRSMYGTYPEYHTSLDNKEFISFKKIHEAIYTLYDICKIIDNNIIVENTIKYCEPQLGKRDLYPSLGASKDTNKYVNAIMWLLNLADGNNDLLSIAERSHIEFETIYNAAKDCLKKKIIKKR